MKDTYEAVTTSYDDIKDKKIIELAKQKRNLLLQIDSLRTKAAKAAESALNYKKKLENRGGEDEQASQASPLKQTPQSSSKLKQTGMNETSMSQMDSADGRKLREMEKRITKLRNENQALTNTVEKATRLLEREIGEVVDID